MRERSRDRERGRLEPERPDARSIPRSSEDARLDRRAERLRQLERDGYGHAVAEHVDATDAQLRQRVQDGTNARGRVGYRPEHATRFSSDRTLVRATEALWRSPEAAEQRATVAADIIGKRPGEQGRRIYVCAPVADALGPDWAHQVAGYSRTPTGSRPARFSDQSMVRATWHMKADGSWYLFTAFPEP